MVPTIVAGGVLVVLPVSVVAGAACVGGVLVCSLCRWCPRVLPVSVVSSCAPCVRGVLVVLPGVGGGWCCLCRWCPRVLPVSVVSSWCSLVSVVAGVACVGGVLVCSLVSVVAGVACVGGVLVCSLCPWCPRGAPWCRWCPRPHIHSRTPKRVHARLFSAAGLSLVNRSCRARLMDMIALIINYLGAPLGIAFIGW